MTADLAEEQTAAQLATERLESEQVHCTYHPQATSIPALIPNLYIPALSQQFYTLAFRTMALYSGLSYIFIVRTYIVSIITAHFLTKPRSLHINI